MVRTLQQKTYYRIQLGSILLGLLTSLYLTIQHTRLKSGIQGSASFCSMGTFADCDVVNASRFSEIFGIPIASLGSCVYFLMLVIALLARPTDKSFSRLQQVLGIIAVLAAFTDLYFLGIQIFALKTACIMCLLTYLATLGVIWSVLGLSPGRKSGLKKSLHSVLIPKGKLELPSRSSLVIGSIASVCFFVAISLIPSCIRTRSQTYSTIDNAVEQFYQQWKDKPRQVIEADEGDGLLGNPAAKVRIVEFSDYQCPHCRKTAFTMHSLLGSLKNRVYFIFKNFPLDSTCNPALRYPLHPNACALAQLGSCASFKGKFWNFHDVIFFNLSEDDMRANINALVPSLKNVFTQKEFEDCLLKDEARLHVSEDIHLANQLSVNSTPSIFINGKLVSPGIPLTIENLTRLIEIEEKL